MDNYTAQARKRIWALADEDYNQRDFIPYPSLHNFLDRDTIYNILNENLSESDRWRLPELVKTILNGGRRLFAILIVIEEGIQSLLEFIKTDQTSNGGLDSILPLENGIEKYIHDKHQKKRFMSTQWKFLPPDISPEHHFREFDKSRILPFLTKTPLTDEGAFCNIFTVKIHEQCNKIPGTSGEVELVCKTITRGSSGRGLLLSDFHHEARILGNLNLVRHPNIIELITAYTIENTCNLLLLPKAEKDLEGLFASKTLPTEFRTSLWPLVSALDLVHRFEFKELDLLQTGCHCDIKPKNILFHDGKLILSDFGLSRLRNVEQGSQSYFKMGEGDYLAPECEDPFNDFKHGKIGRASDIWSLGGVLTEIMVHMSSDQNQDGHAKLEEFRKSRKTTLGGHYKNQSFRSDKAVNPVVVKVLEAQQNKTLSSDPKQKDPKQEFIAELAQIINSMLQFNPSSRYTAEKVLKKLFLITQKSIVEEIYLVLRKYCDTQDKQLEIQRQRLSEWCKISGLHVFPPIKRSKTCWFAIKHDHEQYSSLQSHLNDCLSYTERICTEPIRNTQSSDYLYEGLQKSIDRLYNMVQPYNEEQTVNHPENPRLEDNSTLTQQRPPNSLVKAVEALPIRSSSMNVDMTMLARYRVEAPTTRMTSPTNHCTFKINISSANNSGSEPISEERKSPSFSNATWGITRSEVLPGLFSKLLTFSTGPTKEHAQFWIPIDGITKVSDIVAGDQIQYIFRWSDCESFIVVQREGFSWAYQAYNPQKPNIKLRIVFGNQSVADQFCNLMFNQTLPNSVWQRHYQFTDDDERNLEIFKRSNEHPQTLATQRLIAAHKSTSNSSITKLYLIDKFLHISIETGATPIRFRITNLSVLNYSTKLLENKTNERYQAESERGKPTKQEWSLREDSSALPKRSRFALPSIILREDAMSNLFLSILSWHPKRCVRHAKLRSKNNFGWTDKSEKVFLIYGYYHTSDQTNSLYGAHHIFCYSATAESGKWRLCELDQNKRQIKPDRIIVFDVKHWTKTDAICLNHLKDLKKSSTKVTIEFKYDDDFKYFKDEL